MPTSKNALLRYLTLDKCFQRGDCCVIDLLDECNDALMNDANLNGTKPESVSRRQIEQDIKLMIRQWNIPLTKKQVGHRVY